MNRRNFLVGASGWTAAATASPWLATRTARIPLGVQVYSVHDLARSDMCATLARIREIGFETVEFETTCIECGTDAARSLRRCLDDLGLRCPSTHCHADNFSGEPLYRALEVASILGCSLMVMPHPAKLTEDWRTIAGWRNVVRILNAAVGPAHGHGMQVVYHNHQPEFLPLAERRAPVEIIAGETDPAVGLELDVANCLASDGDPAAFLARFGARVVAMHLKDWSRIPGRGYSVPLGQGSANWNAVLRRALAHVRPDCYFVEMEPRPGALLTNLARDFESARELMARARR